MPEIDVKLDNLVDKLEAWKRSDSNAGTINAETRQDKGQFQNDYGVHKTSLSWIAKLDKLDDDKRDDILSSFDHLRGIIEPKWIGQSTPDMFDDGETPSEAEAGEEVEFDDDDEADMPVETDEEIEAFDAEVDAVVEDNVVALGKEQSA